MKPALKLIISIAIPLAVGGISSAFTSSGVDGWFRTINKPSFNPPDTVFAPVWTTLYILMGIAFYLIWKARSSHKTKKVAVVLYNVQLLFNFLWSIIFFALHRPGWALVDIIALWISIVATIFWFGKISPVAAWLLVPYICWVSFATLLNYCIWALN